MDDDTYPQCGVIEKNKLFTDNDKIELGSIFFIDKYKNNYFVENHKNATVSVAANNTLYCMSNNNNYPFIFLRKDTDKLIFLKRRDQGNVISSSCKILLKGYYRD